MEVEQTQWQRTIDEALIVVYSHHHRLVQNLFPGQERKMDLDELRESKLGRDLSRLAALARGEIDEPRERVKEWVDNVLQLLFWAPMTEDYTVPRKFWEGELGRMMSLAKMQAYDRSELMSIGNAAQRLGVTRPTIYRWMDDKHLDYVRDEMSGRTFVVQEDVESLLNAQDSVLEAS